MNAYTKDKNKSLNIYTRYLHVAQLWLKIAKKKDATVLKTNPE